MEMYDDVYLRRMADVGMSLVLFKETAVYQFLSAKARREAIDAMHELKEVDPTKSMDIQAIQNRIKLAESFELWIEQGISQALAAQEQMSIAKDARWDQEN